MDVLRGVKAADYVPPPKHSRQLTVRLDLIASGRQTKLDRIRQAAADAKTEIVELKKTIRQLQSLIAKIHGDCATSTRERDGIFVTRSEP